MHFDVRSKRHSVLVCLRARQSRVLDLLLVARARSVNGQHDQKAPSRTTRGAEDPVLPPRVWGGGPRRAVKGGFRSPSRRPRPVDGTGDRNGDAAGHTNNAGSSFTRRARAFILLEESVLPSLKGQGHGAGVGGGGWGGTSGKRPCACTPTHLLDPPLPSASPPLPLPRVPNAQRGGGGGLA